jgi:preprotein translocase subunit YajC
MLGSAAMLMTLPAMASAQTAAPTSASGASAQQSSASVQQTPSGTDSAVTAPPTADSPKLAQGVTVLDQNGGTVGTVQSIDGDFVVLATTKSKVRLPKSSFALGAKGPVISMTAAQVDQAAAQAAPQATASADTAASKPKVVKGAAVADTQGGAVGTVADVDAKFATVTLTTGGKVRLPVTAFGAGDNGSLRVAMTAAQLSAAAGAAKGG